MAEELTEEQLREQLKPPPARPRAERGNRNSGGDEKPGPGGQQPPSPKPQEKPKPSAPVAPKPAAAVPEHLTGTGAHARLARRTAGQAFLPLVSQSKKLRETTEEAELALDQALAAGVNPAELEIDLYQLITKAGAQMSWLPDEILDKLPGRFTE